MKNLKKILCILLALTMVFGVVACGDKNKDKDSDKNKTENVSGEGTDVSDVEVSDEPVELSTTEQILVDMYDKSPMDFPIMTWLIDITDANQVKSYAGIEASLASVKSITVSEPAMSSQAYSVVLVEVNDGADTAVIAEEMKNGVNPEKWGDVKADDMSVVTEGKYICLVMISSEYKDMATAEELTSVCLNVIKGEDADTNNTESDKEKSE